jgi:hypothetical protein
MPQVMETPARPFTERRQRDDMPEPHTRERRQFVDGHAELSPEAQELAQAIDTYKLTHRRRFITYEEMLNVMQSLGYHR